MVPSREYQGCCSSVGPAGPMGPRGPQGPQGLPGPQGVPGPAGTAATAENAMAYSIGEQTVAPGGAVSFEVQEVHSARGITAGTEGFRLPAGQYLLGFVSDARAAGTGVLGAVLSLSGVPLAYTESRIDAGQENPQTRLSLYAVLTLTAEGQLTVVNNTANDVIYDFPVLTAVRLA